MKPDKPKISVPREKNALFQGGAILGRSGHHLVLHMSKNSWLLTTKAAVQQPLTLASTNFSEVRSANGKCRRNLVNFAAQFSEFGIKASVGILACTLCSSA
jgi:hypothetical protein